MSEPAGTLVSTLLQRVRDEHGIAVPRDFARQVLSLAHRVTNAKLEHVTEAATFTVTPTQQLYPITANFPKAVKIADIRASDGGTTYRRELRYIQWKELTRVDRQWLRRLGPRLEVFTTIGRDVFALHPGREGGDSVQVFYVKWLDDLTQDASVTELPDDHLPLVLDVAELILLVRMRQFDPVRALLKNIAARFKVEFEEAIMDTMNRLPTPKVA